MNGCLWVSLNKCVSVYEFLLGLCTWERVCECPECVSVTELVWMSVQSECWCACMSYAGGKKCPVSLEWGGQAGW